MDSRITVTTDADVKGGIWIETDNTSLHVHREEVPMLVNSILAETGYPEPLSMSELQKKLAAWRDEQFPGHTISDSMEKLREEVEELSYGCIVKSTMEIAKEAADVVIVAMGIMSMCGIDFEDAVRNKAEIVLKRKYKDGVLQKGGDK